MDEGSKKFDEFEIGVDDATDGAVSLRPMDGSVDAELEGTVASDSR